MGDYLYVNISYNDKGLFSEPIDASKDDNWNVNAKNLYSSCIDLGKNFNIKIIKPKVLKFAKS
jgi:hypothetical protein